MPDDHGAQPVPKLRLGSGVVVEARGREHATLEHGRAEHGIGEQDHHEGRVTLVYGPASVSLSDGVRHAGEQLEVSSLLLGSLAVWIAERQPGEEAPITLIHQDLEGAVDENARTALVVVEDHQTARELGLQALERPLQDRRQQAVSTLEMMKDRLVRNPEPLRELGELQPLWTAFAQLHLRCVQNAPSSLFALESPPLRHARVYGLTASTPDLTYRDVTYTTVSKGVQMRDDHFRPLEAARAIRRLMDDPDATEHAFAVVRAIDGGGFDRLVARWRQDPLGQRLLRERPSLVETLEDRSRLRAMPQGSLAHAYLAFCEREGITPDGLVEASESDEREELGDEERFIADRMRDSHDLWHVVTGCRTDLAGELAVLAFTTAQTRGFGVGAIVVAGYLRSFQLGDMGKRGRQLAREGFARGWHAEWLPAADWESLLALPIEEARARLGITSVATYAPFYEADRQQAFAA